jgi:hypothetical protein
MRIILSAYDEKSITQDLLCVVVEHHKGIRRMA